MTIKDRDRELASVLWDYHLLNWPLPDSADLLLVAGSHDDRVAVFAAEVWARCNVNVVVTSGGFGKVTRHTSSEPEGARFRDILVRNGVPEDVVFAEVEATNTGDNFVNTRELLYSLNIQVASGVVVTKPYMERRALATGQKQWPEVPWTTASPPIGFSEYATEDSPERRMIELMVGDLQRIDVFAKKGFQTHQDIPETVWSAYNGLVEAGFDRFVIRE